MGGHNHAERASANAAGVHDAQSSGADKSQRTRLLIVFILVFGFMSVEFFAAFQTNSLALLADAAHMLTDALGLMIALIASSLVRRPATTQRTWGYQRAEVIAAAFQALVLLGVGIYVVIQAILRFFAPPELQSGGMLWVGLIGLAVNILGLWILSGAQGNLNMRAAVLEVLNDAFGSVAVVVASLVIAATGFTQADSIASILIGVLIIPRTVRLLIESVSVLMGNAPKDLNLADVRAHLEKLDGVLSVHDLHATRVCSTLAELSAHVVVSDEIFYDGRAHQLLNTMQECVAKHFPLSVQHSTFQLEPSSHQDVEKISH